MYLCARHAAISGLCVVLSIAAAPASAQPGKPSPGAGAVSCQALPAEKPGKPDAGPSTQEKLSFSQAVKGLSREDGLFPLYENPQNGDLFMEIGGAGIQESKSFIYHMQVMQGVTVMGVVPTMYSSSKLLKLSKHFDKIEFTQKNTNFYIDPDSALARSADDSISDALLVSTKILAEDGEGEEARYLICANEIFATEALVSVTPKRDPSEGMPGAPEKYSVGNVDASKSKIIGHRNYPENTDVRVEYVMAHPASARFAADNNSVLMADPRYVSLQVSHMLIEAPENNGFEPRHADFRVGFFGPQKDDLSTVSATPYHDFISRWNLKKKYPNEEISEPVEPIVWWISNSTPVEMRDDIARGVLVWNKALERAGFKDAIVVRQQPDDADWDAGDLRYNVIYFGSNPRSFFHGYGPHISDPRTGQILGADIALDYSIMKRGDSYARSFGGSNEAINDLLADELFSQEHAQECQFGSFMLAQAELARAVLAARGASEELREKVIRQLAMSVITHEVGHTLGLSHNMKASSSVSLEELSKPDGLTTGSIMDYVPANFAPIDGVRENYYQTDIGPYDYWAIEFGYRPALEDPAAEAERMHALLSRSTDPALAFGNDAEVVQYNLGVDPRTLMGDMSNDLVSWTALQAQNINEAIGRLEETHSDSDEAFQDVRSALELLLSSKRTLIATLSMMVGGAHMEIATAEQLKEAGKAPFEPLSKEEQQRAVDLVIKLAYAKGAYDVLSPSLLKHAQNTRRGFDLGEPGKGEPISALDVVANDQAFLLRYLMSPLRLNRLTMQETLGGKYSSYDLLNTLTDAIFEGSCFTKADQYQRVGQAAYLEKLIQITSDEAYDENAKAAANASLTKISGRISGLCNFAVGDEVAGHRKRLRRMMSAR